MSMDTFIKNLLRVMNLEIIEILKCFKLMEVGEIGVNGLSVQFRAEEEKTLDLVHVIIQHQQIVVPTA